MSSGLGAVFFDLDGTLADTAADLLGALERLCAEEGRPAPDYESFRPIASLGSPAWLRTSFACEPHHPEYGRLRDRLLSLYHEDIASRTTLFPDVDQVLRELEQAGVKWGIVTNKPGWLTLALLDALDFGGNAVCVISGDTLPRRKPAPDQLLLASRQAACPAERCVYVGDSRGDITAGREAGMHTVAASFGYIPRDEDPVSWAADAVIDSPLELLHWLRARFEWR